MFSRASGQLPRTLASVICINKCPPNIILHALVTPATEYSMLRHGAAIKALTASRASLLFLSPANRVPSPNHSSVARRISMPSSAVALAQPATSAMGSVESQAALQMTSPLPGASWGAEVRGIDLREDLSPAAFQQLLSNLTRFDPNTIEICLKPAPRFCGSPCHAFNQS